jgi:hypothetical protein
MPRLPGWLVYFRTMGLFCLLWYALSVLSPNTLLLPSPFEVAAALKQTALDGELFVNAATSLVRLVISVMAWNNQLAVAMHARALKGDFEPGFMVKLAHKDCRLALAMNHALSVDAPVGAATLKALQEAIDNGLAGKDVGALLKLREDSAGVQVRLA